MPQALKEIETWSDDPSYSGLPQETKRLILNNYFDKNLSDDEFLSLPEETRETIKDNFFSSNLVEKPAEIPAIEPGKELDLTDIDAALDKKLGDMTSRFQPDIAPAESTGVELLTEPPPPVEEKPELTVEELGALETGIPRVPEKPEVLAGELKKRGFFANIKKSYELGTESAYLDLLSSEASMGFRDWGEVKELRDEYQERLSKDPVEAENWLEKAVYGAAGMVGPMAKGYAEGSIAAMGAFAIGQAGPQALAPEELITVPGAFKVGATQYWYRQGMGQIYSDLREKGVSHEIASPVSQGAALPYALIEMLQVSGITSIARKKISTSIGRAILKGVTQYGTLVAKETGEEVLQEGVSIGAMETAKALSNLIDKTDISHTTKKEIKDKLIQSVKESVGPLAILTAPVGLGGIARGVGGVPPVAPVTPVSSEVPPKMPTVTPERITPVEPVIEPKAEITPKITPEVPPEASVVMPEEKPPVVEKIPEAPKEPWQMTQKRFREDVKDTEDYKILSAEDIELKPEIAKHIDKIANWDVETGEIHAYKMGEEEIYNHADIFTKHKMKEGKTIVGFVDKKGNFIYQYPQEAHKLFVKQALVEGKSVPEEVLAEYPELRVKPVIEEPVVPTEKLAIPPKEKKPLAEKVPEKPAEVEDTYLNMGIPLVMPDVVQKKINTIKKLFKEPTGINKRVWDITKDYWGKKAGLEFKYSDKWNKTLRAKVPVEGKKTILRKQKFKDKFSSDELEDAIFYRQRTSNIWKGEKDTFKNVADRMPQELKDFVDGEVDEHINNWRKMWNESPFTKDIEAREEVIKTYLTGVYSGNITKGYEYLVGLKGRSFVTNNFMLNKKTYLNFEEAFRKGGLVPRFRNLADQLDYQDAHMIRLFANNELIGKINQLEKEINSKLIVRANSKLYDEAKVAKDEDGNTLYVPYMDPHLRSYVAGKRADGSLIWATRKEPALVYRDASDALQSIFSKDAYKPENIFWRNYDRIGSLLRYMRVTFSGFHFVPLVESLVGGKGVSVLNIPKWVKHGEKLLADPIFMTEVKEARLTVIAPSEVSRSQVEGSIQNIVNVLEAQGIEKKILAKGIKYITAPQFRLTRFLFDEYRPILKVQMYYDYKQKALALAEKKGIQYNETQMKELNGEIASIVNDQFGGQAWEMIRVLNDPKIMKWMHRAIGYPDWSISALRQAGAIGEGGIRGKLARRYWLRYGIAFLAVQNALSYLFTGLYNDEDDEGKIKWSWEKAHSTFKNIDPTSKHKVDFQLPDIEIDLPLIGKFNPGRQLKKDGTYGRRYYSHFGKQMLEIPRYALSFNEQMFAKSNPVIQIVFKQIFGGAPYKGGIFPARGGYDIAGQYKPWKGKKGLERWRERAIQVVTDATPFSIQSMWSTSPATAGLLPISKATSLYASQEYIEKALRKNDANELLNIVASLLDSGYDIKSIKRSITTIGKNIVREKVEKEINK